uniref:Uncharacterized protein n=1 Tax=Octopus bimaculoides TaxID=37653 RepID=A0A0L8I824_OCTBM
MSSVKLCFCSSNIHTIMARDISSFLAWPFVRAPSEAIAEIDSLQQINPTSDTSCYERPCRTFDEKTPRARRRTLSESGCPRKPVKHETITTKRNNTDHTLRSQTNFYFKTKQNIQ